MVTVAMIMIVMFVVMTVMLVVVVMFLVIVLSAGVERTPGKQRYGRQKESCDAGIHLFVLSINSPVTGRAPTWRETFEYFTI